MPIKDIANKAGVSASTVSRVLNNPEYNSKNVQLRNRIFEIARDLNYVPNEAARNLKANKKSLRKTYYLSILVTRIDSAEVDPFCNELVRNIESEIYKSMCILSKVVYKPIFSNERKCESENIGVQLNALFSDKQKTNGIIIVGKCCNNVIKELKKRCSNLVSVNRNPVNSLIDEVVCDGRKIADKAVKYLVSLGHRKIGYVGDCHSEARFKGWQEALSECNLEQNIDFMIQAQLSEEQGFEAMKKIIGLEDRPTGIYFANDIIAVGALKCLNRYSGSYYHPSIISSDDIDEAQYTKPMLTTVHLPKDEMAKFALQLLLDSINKGHRTITKIEFESTLVVRESCSSVDNSVNCEYYI